MCEEEFNEEFHRVESDDAKWKPCAACGGEIIQIRKAYFECQRCFYHFVADEGDMKL